MGEGKGKNNEKIGVSRKLVTAYSRLGSARHQQQQSPGNRKESLDTGDRGAGDKNGSTSRANNQSRAFRGGAEDVWSCRHGPRTVTGSLPLRFRSTGTRRKHTPCGKSGIGKKEEGQGRKKVRGSNP